MGFNMRASLMPQGIHLVEISDVKEGRSKGKDLKQWTITLRGWDHPDETVMTWWPLEGKMTFKTRRLLAMLGFAPDAIVEESQLIAKKVYVAIKHEEYRGEMGAKVDEDVEPSTFGFWAESNPPKEVTDREAGAADIFAPTPPAADAPNDGGPAMDDTPF